MEKEHIGQTSQMPQIEENYFRMLSNQYETCQQNGLWEGVYFVFSCNIKIFVDSSNETLKNEAASRVRHIKPYFFAAAPDNLVEKILNQYAVFFEKTRDEIILQAICRSPHLVRAGFRIYPKFHSEIVSTLVRLNPPWLKEVSTELNENISAK